MVLLWCGFRVSNEGKTAQQCTAELTVVRGSQLRKGERKMVAVSSGGPKAGQQGSGSSWWFAMGLAYCVVVFLFLSVSFFFFCAVYI